VNGYDFKILRQQKGISQAKFSKISGVSQSKLSAFELGKNTLNEEELARIYSLLKDNNTLSELQSLKKKYQKHEYHTIKKDPFREKKVSLSNGNPDYLRELDKLFTDHKKPKLEKISALSLFSGCGGLSLGFSASGYKIKAFLELDPGLRKIYKSNFSDSYEIGGDITLVNEEDLRKTKEEIGQVDVIIGGPPCQGFSLSGKREASDPRNQLFRHYLKVVDIFHPKVALIENVRLLSSMKNSKNTYVIDEIKMAFEEKGYKIKSFEVNAKNYGVPQHRERIFFIAVRKDIETKIGFPDISYGNSLFSMPFRTFADACSDLDFLESGDHSKTDSLHQAVKHPSHVIKWLWDVDEGRSAHENKDESNRPPSGYNTTYKRQIWNEPASTVQTTFGMISGCRNVHPISTRSLTIREAARIQSFPDQYKFDGSLGTIRTGIGNAVPPALAFKIAEYIKRYL
jgi:DNA (cytosine-5)-methyltransferase 1